MKNQSCIISTEPSNAVGLKCETLDKSVPSDNLEIQDFILRQVKTICWERGWIFLRPSHRRELCARHCSLRCRSYDPQQTRTRGSTDHDARSASRGGPAMDSAHPQRATRSLCGDNTKVCHRGQGRNPEAYATHCHWNPWRCSSCAQKRAGRKQVQRMRAASCTLSSESIEIARRTSEAR